jgi:hypothetical protein
MTEIRITKKTDNGTQIYSVSQSDSGEIIINRITIDDNKKTVETKSTKI